MSIFNTSPSAAAELGRKAATLALCRDHCAKLVILLSHCEQQIITLAQLQADLVITADLLPIIGSLSFQKEKWKIELAAERKTEQEIIVQLGDDLEEAENCIIKYKSKPKE